MIDAINWWLSFRRNSTLHDWMREQYSREELKRLIPEATDSDLTHPYDLMAQVTYLDGAMPVLRRTVSRLYHRYGDEIWSACYRSAARGRPTNGYDFYSSWLEAFGTLPMAYQVITHTMLEELLVRNALRQCAIEILIEGSQGSPFKR